MPVCSFLLTSIRSVDFDALMSITSLWISIFVSFWLLLLPGTTIGVASRGPDGMLQPRVKEMWVKFFMRTVSFFQWAGESIGVVLFFWTGAVVVGAFCSNLVPEDFWSATLIIFVKAFR